MACSINIVLKSKAPLESRSFCTAIHIVRTSILPKLAGQQILENFCLWRDYTKIKFRLQIKSLMIIVCSVLIETT